MKTITLCGLQYVVSHTPSVLELVGEPLALGYNGRGWVVCVYDTWYPKEYPSRDDAAQVVASCYLHGWDVVNQS